MRSIDTVKRKGRRRREREIEETRRGREREREAERERKGAHEQNSTGKGGRRRAYNEQGRGGEKLVVLVNRSGRRPREQSPGLDD